MTSRLLTSLGLFAAAGAIFFVSARNRDGYGLLDLLAGRAVAAPATYTPAEGPALKSDDVPLLEKINAENTRLVEAVAPSVVSVNTTRIIRGRYMSLDGFFGPRLHTQEIQQTGLGSGVIVTKEGHVVTNFHVIENVDEIQVTLHDGSKSLAELVGMDRDTDIAVLKIQDGKVKEFPALAFADSDKVKVGEMVWAIGNPFGLRESVTQGIINHRDRQLSDSDSPKFQTDAVINPGNSGGPMVNTRGEIIGINVAIYTGEQGVHSWQGIGFAIPANDARRAFERIMQGGRERIGYLGLRAENQPLRAGEDGSVFITDVYPGSPAEKAGLKAGDVILKFGGHPLVDYNDFYARINRRPIGQPVEITISRDKQVMTLQPVVADREEALTQEEKNAERRDLRDQMGISVQNLSPASRGRLGLPEDFGGISVSEVVPDSAAAGTIQRNDIIYEVNKTTIDSVEKFFSVISTLKGKSFPLKYVRRGIGYTAKITLAE